MIIKAVTFFLIAMLVLGMFGRLRLPGGFKKKQIQMAKKCPDCGAYKVGDGTCPCKTS